MVRFSAANKTRIGLLGSDRMGLWIGSDSGSDRITDRIRPAIRLKFKVESDCLFVVVRLRMTRLKEIGVRRLLVNENNVY